MNIKKITAIAISILICIIFTGCSSMGFLGIESLLRPPKITGDNAALQSAFEKDVGKNVVLFSPVSGNFRSAYILFDYDGNGTEEALVFYAQTENKNVVHMHLMTEQNNEWYSVADVIGSGTDVYKVDFFDLDNNSDKEIAVTWVQEDAKRDKTMSLYKIRDLYKQSETALTSIATVQLVDYIYLDIDNDTENELLYFYFDSTEEKAKPCAKLLEFNSKDMTLLPVSNISLNPQITSFIQIAFDKQDDTYRIYLDCMRSDTNYCTELIVYDSDKNVLTLPESDGSKVSDLTLRTNSLVCTDFNHDGYIDIPATLSFKKPEQVKNDNKEQDSSADSSLLIEWLMFDENKLTSAGKYFLNFNDGYSVNIDDFYDFSYIYYDSASRVASFMLYDKEEDNTLFTVSCRKKSDDNYDDEKDQTKDYLVTVTAEGQARNITQKSVIDLIENY